MKKFKLPNKLNNLVNKASFKLAKHSPEILMTVGVVGTIASTVLACKATTKLGDIIDETKDFVEKIHTCAESEEERFADYSKEDAKKDLAITYTQTAIKIARLYAPAVSVGGMAIVSMLASNNILRKRNVALAAAYTTIDKSFKEYRNRVVDRFGKEVDHQLRYNIKAQEFEETIVDEKGKEKTVKKTVEVADLNGYSDYARFFDEASPYWEKNAEYNLTFLRSQQNYANDLLRANGRLFLNDVYKMLGIPETKAGQVVGWIYDPKNPIGDNYVDFGIYDTNRPEVRDFVNGYERVILLDFNVDGNIWDRM